MNQNTEQIKKETKKRLLLLIFSFIIMVFSFPLAIAVVVLIGVPLRVINVDLTQEAVISLLTLFMSVAVAFFMYQLWKYMHRTKTKQISSETSIPEKSAHIFDKIITYGAILAGLAIIGMIISAASL